MSFSVVQGTASITGNRAAFLRNDFRGTATVPSSSATLLDNRGLPPDPRRGRRTLRATRIACLHRRPFQRGIEPTRRDRGGKALG
ncbi:MAG: hypothetical protein JRI25_05680 [Deltaproteobacteria bacterium]|nr:hypothetical protein [Deltaproteobacteria bacterium]